MASPFAVTCSAKGGSAITRWSVSLDGVSVFTASNVSSIATSISASAATHSLAIKAQDLNGASATIKDTITVSSPATTSSSVAPLQITTTTLPSGTVGTSYSSALQAAGGTAPYAWSVVSGSLPAGLALSTRRERQRHSQFRRAGHVYAASERFGGLAASSHRGTDDHGQCASGCEPCDHIDQLADGDCGHGLQRDADGIRRHAALHLDIGKRPTAQRHESVRRRSHFRHHFGYRHVSVHRGSDAMRPTLRPPPLQPHRRRAEQHSGIHPLVCSNSFWNTPISASASVDPNSASMISYCHLPVCVRCSPRQRQCLGTELRLRDCQFEDIHGCLHRVLQQFDHGPSDSCGHLAKHGFRRPSVGHQWRE